MTIKLPFTFWRRRSTALPNFNEKFEKLLHPRWWKGRKPQDKEQYWRSMASAVNPQSQALLDTMQEKFNAHIGAACDLEGDDKKRLRSLDRALAISEMMDEIAREMAAAPEVVKEMERKAREEAEQGNLAER